MPVELLWTPRAEEDLAEIYSLIVLDNVAAAFLHSRFASPPYNEEIPP
jgi:hypothetical protein